ncbi:hypothetical protein BLNAU_10699 [Blattamonas nauphoetae]|uniref:Uncharacterized protein n=1 Tax=Blattamonas nauphoetae TaxID=2049346 RepID=A0ABQ9XPL3_9EUKA|nr:hypothetical protein BLNAU_10699 [Blattamonas nauphoetae]
MKFQPSLDIYLEAKAVKFLKSVDLNYQKKADAFLNSFGRATDESLTNFIQSIVVLVSSPSQVIATSAMEMLKYLIVYCSATIRLALVKADLMHQLILTLNPLSLSFAEAVDMHINVMKIVQSSLWLTTPYGLSRLKIKGDNAQQAVHETVLKQVLFPSEEYISHLCANRFLIIDGDLSKYFLDLLAQLIWTCPHYQPTMDFVIRMPVVLAIPSCLAFLEENRSFWSFLVFMVNFQWGWNCERGKVRQISKTVHRMLRMEGIADVIEEKLRNDKRGLYGGDIIANSIKWNNQQGMNLHDVGRNEQEPAILWTSF